MPADLIKFAIPVLFGVMVLVLLYLRVRRNIGPQRLRRQVLMIRMGIMLVGGVATLSTRSLSFEAITYGVVGLLVGLGIAIFALRHTKYEVTDQGVVYTPHLFIGLGVTGLLIGRLLYRLYQAAPNMQGGPRPYGQDTWAASLANPLTLGFLFLLIGYYFFYYGGILRDSRDLNQARLPENPARS